MKKNVVNKIIAAAFASALVVSMAACGDTKTPASGSIADASSSADGYHLEVEDNERI